MNIISQYATLKMELLQRLLERQADLDRWYRDALRDLDMRMLRGEFIIEGSIDLTSQLPTLNPAIAVFNADEIYKYLAGGEYLYLNFTVDQLDRYVQMLQSALSDIEVACDGYMTFIQRHLTPIEDNLYQHMLGGKWNPALRDEVAAIFKRYAKLSETDKDNQ